MPGYLGEKTPVPALNRNVLLVDDHKLVLDSTSWLLRNRGFSVQEAADGGEASVKLASERFSVVILDSVAVDVALSIQDHDPYMSIIFFSGSANDPDLRQKVARSHLRVGDFLDKTGEGRSALPRSVQKEALKASLRVAMDRPQSQELSPALYLRELIRQEPDLPSDLVAEVVAELQDEEDLLPLEPGESVPDMAAMAREIDGVYSQIRKMITEHGDDPGLADAVRPLREKLRSLQREEAEGIELHVRSQLLFDPREASRLLDRAERLLKDRQ